MKICIAFQSIAANEMNGDFILQKKIAGGTLVLLADGMGGLDFPEQASKIVCEAILDYFESYNASVPSKIIQESLEYADKTLRKACYLEKPLYFDPFGQIEFAHFGHNIITPCKVLV